LKIRKTRGISIKFDEYIAVAILTKIIKETRKIIVSAAVFLGSYYNCTVFDKQ